MFDLSSKFNSFYSSCVVLPQEVLNRLYALKNINMSKRNQKYHFATNEEIKSRGIVSGTNKQKEIISSHTEKILQDNEQFLIKEKYTGHIFEVSL